MTITELLEAHGIQWVGEGHRHSSKGWINVNCPNCDQDDEKYHLGINLKGQYANCWKCGPQSIQAIFVYGFGIPWNDVRNSFSIDENQFFPKNQVKILKRNFAYPKGTDHLLGIHKEYLRNRGFDPEELRTLWGILGTGLTARLPWRIIIPMRYNDIAVSWTSRSLHDKGLRYVNARPQEESISIKKCLFGFDYVRHSTIVTEGPFDAMRIGPGAVATLGTGYSQAQLLKLSKIPLRAICFDNDRQAQRRARKLADELAVFPGVTKVVQIDADDPGSASKKEVSLLRKEFLE